MVYVFESEQYMIFVYIYGEIVIVKLATGIAEDHNGVSCTSYATSILPFFRFNRFVIFNPLAGGEE